MAISDTDEAVAQLPKGLCQVGHSVYHPQSDLLIRTSGHVPGADWC
jgi:hypothetical protein